MKDHVVSSPVLMLFMTNTSQRKKTSHDFKCVLVLLFPGHVELSLTL